MANKARFNFVRGAELGNGRRARVAGDVSEQSVSSSASIFADLTGLRVDAASSAPTRGITTATDSSKSLPETNIGFKLLKKSGWKEGSGLGLSEQGILNPVEPQLKSDRRGVGAEKQLKRKARKDARQSPAPEDEKMSKKEKNLSRKAKKQKAEEEQMQERAFEQEFYRQFWPENV